MTEKIPKWKKPEHIQRNIEYAKKNYVRVNIQLNKATDEDLIKIYESIPNKRAWFKECLRNYKGESE